MWKKELLRFTFKKDTFKKMHYSTLDEKSITDDRHFWKTVKLLLSNKLLHKEKISLSENGEILKTDRITVKILNTFFSNVVQNLIISRFPDSDPLIRNIIDLTLKAILSYKKHPSIISTVYSISFVEVNGADIEKEVLNLNGIRLFKIWIC